MQKYLLLVLLASLVLPQASFGATVYTATTTINLSICGNSIVDSNEQCDVPGEIGLYSTTILGRQCNAQCDFGPYCGDGILQTTYGEECDDANNDSGDFCSATCTIEPAGSGGGGSSGGGGGGGGPRDLGDSSISIVGTGYPNQQINFLLDTKAVGSVRANSTGRFEFSTKASPGTATLGVWANDSTGVRSITLNSTFDVTQGAVTNVNGLLLAANPITFEYQSEPRFYRDYFWSIGTKRADRNPSREQ
jgi:cysteine-rich repeat protein